LWVANCETRPDKARLGPKSISASGVLIIPTCSLLRSAIGSSPGISAGTCSGDKFFVSRVGVRCVRPGATTAECSSIPQSPTVELTLTPAAAGLITRETSRDRRIMAIVVVVGAVVFLAIGEGTDLAVSSPHGIKLFPIMQSPVWPGVSSLEESGWPPSSGLCDKISTIPPTYERVGRSKSSHCSAAICCAWPTAPSC